MGKEASLDTFKRVLQIYRAGRPEKSFAQIVIPLLGKRQLGHA
jgi:hypothetical protein